MAKRLLVFAGLLLLLALAAALSSLAHGRAWDELPGDVQQTLVLSRRYRDLYPPARPSPSLDEALAFIPDLPIDPDSCSPAVRHFLSRGVS